MNGYDENGGEFFIIKSEKAEIDLSLFAFKVTVV